MVVDVGTGAMTRPGRVKGLEVCTSPGRGLAAVGLDDEGAVRGKEIDDAVDVVAPDAIAVANGQLSDRFSME